MRCIVALVLGGSPFEIRGEGIAGVQWFDLAWRCDCKCMDGEMVELYGNVRHQIWERRRLMPSEVKCSQLVNA